MEKLHLLAGHRCFGGTLNYYRHRSDTNQCDMHFTVFVPPQAEAGRKLPVLTYLSGLTCTEENFTIKAGAYRVAAELGFIIVVPDTSPRGNHVYDEPSENIGKGAGFYINARQEPWVSHYQMENYIVQELNALILSHFPADQNRQGILGHSMGGHGALTLYFKYPHIYRSVSALAPIVNPSQVLWCQNLFASYLGNDKEEWLRHDACELVKSAQHDRLTQPILIDQGTADPFWQKSLHPDMFAVACKEAGQVLNLRYQQGYDHSYFFVQSFIDDHLRHHNVQLQG